MSRAVVREIKVNPRPGWVRNDGTSKVSLLEHINRLTAENEQLRSEAAPDPSTIISIENLSSGSDKFLLEGEVSGRDQNGVIKTIEWSTKATWDDIFKDIGPALINESSEDDLRYAIARFWGWSDEVPEGFVQTSQSIEPEVWNQIIVQFRALGYMAKGLKRRGVNDKNRYWSITPRGDQYLLGLLARKRPG